MAYFKIRVHTNLITQEKQSWTTSVRQLGGKLSQTNPCMITITWFLWQFAYPHNRRLVLSLHYLTNFVISNDVYIKKKKNWKRFPHNCPFVWRIHRSSMSSTHKGSVMWIFDIFVASRAVETTVDLPIIWRPITIDNAHSSPLQWKSIMLDFCYSLGNHH